MRALWVHQTTGAIIVAGFFEMQLPEIRYQETCRQSYVVKTKPFEWDFWCYYKAAWEK